MTAQQGFQYEKNVADYLKSIGISGAEPAGARSDRPDLTLDLNGKKVGVELKISMASAGSLVLKHHNGKWQFNEPKGEEQEFLMAVAKAAGVFKEIEKSWKKTPLKRTPLSKTEQDAIKKLPKGEAYKIDLANFKDLYGNLQASVIEEYYNRKDTYYINIGTHGFYLLGSKDPAGFNRKINGKRIDTFAKAATAKWRARVQYKGSGTYQFTFELQFQIPVSNKSNYNLGAVDGKSVSILSHKTDASFLL